MDDTKPQGWLCLNRAVGETIIVGDEKGDHIKISVSRIFSGRQVRICISAPARVPIRRAEVEPREGPT